MNSIQFNAGTGLTLSNHPDFPDVNENAKVLSLAISGRLSGQKNWHKYYHHPYFGFQFAYAELGNNAVLGYYLGLMPEMTFTIPLSDTWMLEPTMGLGLAYFSKPYDEISNPENVVIGSKFTFSPNAGLTFSRIISPVSSLQFKLLLIHCSNSHFQLPNVGLNLPVFQVGYRYRLKVDVKPSDTIPITSDRSWRPTIRLSFGMNEQGSSTIPVNGPKYPIYLGTVYMSHKLTPINKVYAGLEYYFNTGVKDYILSQDFYDEKINKRSSVIALTFGHEFLMGHFGLTTTLGVYIYNKFYQDKRADEEKNDLKSKIKTYVPARIGVQYYLKDATSQHRNNLYYGIYIKSNFGQADFLETGIGYTF